MARYVLLSSRQIILFANAITRKAQPPSSQGNCLVPFLINPNLVQLNPPEGQFNNYAFNNTGPPANQNLSTVSN